jgi:hypothetical protein
MSGVYMKARVYPKFVVIEIANLSIRYKKTDPRVRVNSNSNSVFWRSPLIEIPIPIPIKQ